MTAASKEIVSILHRYVMGTPLLERETAILKQWVRADPANESVWLAAQDYTLLRYDLSRLDEYQHTMPDLLQQFWNQQLTPAKAFKSPDIPSVRRIYLLKTSWIKYAAAVILILGATVYFWMANKKKEQKLADSTALVKDIAPGGDRAILTLASGRQIILDSTEGTIVKQGNLSVINLAGKLKYEGVGTSAEYNTISTPKGGQYQIVLPDGSKVWLNAASSIKFPTAFAGRERNVDVTGEVYMEIAPLRLRSGSNRSFIVKVNGAEIQVLGTSFNVNAYEDENAIRTTLINGSVKIITDATGKLQSQEVLLKPGQQCSVVSGQLSVVANANIEQALAWKKGKFLFTNADIQSIMREVARWYDVEVQFENNIDDKFYAEIDRNTNISTLFKMLEKTKAVHFKMEGKKIMVMK